MKKHLSLMAASLIALSACGDGGDSASADLEDQAVFEGGEGATELTFWTFQDLHNQFFEDAVVRWNETYPDRQITLIAEVYPFDQMHNNLLLSLQSGQGAPDLVDIEIRQSPNYLQGDIQLVPLNDIVEPVIDDFVASRFNIYSRDGNYYGIDYHVGASVMYYNEEILSQAGVDIDSIETWDDFVAAGRQVVANTDAVMTTFETEDVFSFMQLISQRESDLFDANGNVTIDNDINIEALQFMHDLIHVEEIARVTPGGTHHDESYYGFMNDGGAAAVMMPMWYMGRFLDYMPDLEGKMQIRPVPRWEAGGNRSSGMGGTGTAVTNQAVDQELAKDFLAFAKLSEEGNIALWEVLGFDPIRHDVWDAPEMRADNRYFRYFHDDIFDILLDVRDEITDLNITDYSNAAFQELDSTTLHSALRAMNQSPEDALRQAAQEVRSRMD